MIEGFLWGVGLVLVIEGLVYALAPFIVENLLETLKQMPLRSRRQFGVLQALLGAVILLTVTRYFN